MFESPFFWRSEKKCKCSAKREMSNKSQTNTNYEETRILYGVPMFITYTKMDEWEF